jgi:RimJ/RimL family protein N-acetyltransferase
LLIAWAFQSMNSVAVVIDVEPSNAGSLGVVERLGARSVGARSVTLRDGRTVALPDVRARSSS